MAQVKEMCPRCGAVVQSDDRIQFNGADLSVAIDGDSILLTNNEMIVFETLYDAMPRSVTREFLMDSVYGHFLKDPPETVRIMDTYVSKIRAKTKDTGVSIFAVRGRGYRLEVAA